MLAPMLMFQIGLRVMSKRIGPPVVGEVRGGFLPLGGDRAAPGELADMIADWDAVYPDWRQHPVVFVAMEMSEAERDLAGGDMLRLLAYPAADLEVL